MTDRPTPGYAESDGPDRGEHPAAILMGMGIVEVTEIGTEWRMVLEVDYEGRRVLVALDLEDTAAIAAMAGRFRAKLT